MWLLYSANLRPVRPGELIEESQKFYKEKMSGRPIRVLLIDEDAAAVAELCQKLADAKNVTFSVERVCTLEEGLGLLKLRHFDALIVDLGASGANGIAKLKELQSQAGEIPILVTSPEYQDSEALETVRAGAQDYLVKSRLNAAALERILVHCIERQRGRSRTGMQYLISRALAESRNAARRNGGNIAASLRVP